jgi:hypothetical protein
VPWLWLGFFSFFAPKNRFYKTRKTEKLKNTAIAVLYKIDFSKIKMKKNQEASKEYQARCPNSQYAEEANDALLGVRVGLSPRGLHVKPICV